jgi:hypothetical protein
LRTVCEFTLMPNIAVRPIHHADDIGAMLVLPSGFSELIRTTGVPKYSIFGSITRFATTPDSVADIRSADAAGPRSVR